MSGYPTPEDAVVAGDSVPPEYVKIVAVDYSPDGSYAVVFIEYNEPPDVEDYVVLCEKTDAGWAEGSGGSAGGVSLMATGESGSLGVKTTWKPRAVRWDVQPRSGTEPLVLLPRRRRHLSLVLTLTRETSRRQDPASRNAGPCAWPQSMRFAAPADALSALGAPPSWQPPWRDISIIQPPLRPLSRHHRRGRCNRARHVRPTWTTPCSATDGDGWRGEHPQEVSGQLAAGVPVLQTNQVAVGGVEFAQTELRFLAYNGRRVVFLETQPRDIRLAVVMPVDLHCASMLARSPERDDESSELVTVRRMVVRNRQPAGDNEPIGCAGVLRSASMACEHGVFHIDTGDPQQLPLGQGMIGPRNDPGHLGHQLIIRSVSDGARITGSSGARDGPGGRHDRVAKRC